MLEGKDLILATQKFAKEKRLESWMHLLITLMTFVILYLGIFMNTPLWLKWVCSILAGLNIVRMFVIYHDYAHKTILQNSWLAQGIFTFFGLYILAPLSIWRRSHDYHHKHNSKLYTSSIGSFPIVTKEKYLEAKPQDRAIYLFIRHPLTISAGYIFAFAYGMCIKSFISSKEKHWDSVLSLVLHYSIGILIWIYGGLTLFFLGFLIPSVIASAIGAYLFYAQHNFPGTTFSEKEDWTYTAAALESSSYMKMNFIMRWFTANIGYHHIHHINAKIPFYRLPEVFAAFKEFQHPKTTSLNPGDILACFKLKVWDTEKQQMIGLETLRRK